MFRAIAYIARRLLRMLLCLMLVTVIVFCLMRLLPIETYFKDFDRATELQIHNRLEELGLNAPLPVQFWRYISELLHGSLGRSDIYREGYPVAKILAEKIPVSAHFGLLALCLSLPFGILLGVFMARRKGGLIDKLGTAYIVFVQAVPAAVYFIFLQLCGSDYLGLSILYRPSVPSSQILPIVSMSIPPAAGFAMWTRRFMLDETNKDYVLQARAKGLSSRSIAVRHILRNALVPLSQQLPGTILMTLSGSIYIESLYSIPGMGGLLIEVIRMQDNTMVQSIVLFYAFIGIVGMFLGDICLALSDPRIRRAPKAVDL